MSAKLNVPALLFIAPKPKARSVGGGLPSPNGTKDIRCWSSLRFARFCGGSPTKAFDSIVLPRLPVYRLHRLGLIALPGGGARRENGIDLVEVFRCQADVDSPEVVVEVLDPLLSISACVFGASAQSLSAPRSPSR